MNFLRKTVLLLIISLIVNACATHKLQVEKNTIVDFPEDKMIRHSFYLLGDAGNSKMNQVDSAIINFGAALSEASSNSTAIFLGDNIYPNGLTNKKDKKKLAEHRLKVQTDIAKNFKGRTVFIPGNHDWYSGIKGLKRQEKFVEDELGKNTFLPENGCPIEKVNITDDIVLIIVDSHWYVADWDNYPTINDECDIKTRR